MNKCEGYIDKPGLYALCLLLDVDSYVISQSSAEISPFGMQPGIKVAFDKNTFPDDETTVDFKVHLYPTIIVPILVQFQA